MTRDVQVTEVTTTQAAAAVGRSPTAFRQWAWRQQIRPARRVRVGSTTLALWDLDELLERDALTERQT